MLFLDIQMTPQMLLLKEQSKHTIQLDPGKFNMKSFLGQLHTTHAVQQYRSHSRP
jgi:hypothetical protein